MPYTDEFIKILNHYKRMYIDRARAETFAFEEAFKKGVKTFRPKQSLYKKQKNYV